MVEQGSNSQEVPKTPKSEFVAKVEARWQTVGPVCVGLDSDFSQIPQSLKDRTPVVSVRSNVLQAIHTGEVMSRFNLAIIGETQDLVCAYKPNSAFYEAEGQHGLRALKRTIDFIENNHPEIPVILDCKRGDIGNTNLGYIEAAFDELGADAVTVHPYVGSAFLNDAGETQLEALKPFLERRDKGIIVVCRTSNPSAGEIQDLPVDLTRLGYAYKKKFGDMDELREIVESDVVPVYQIVAYRVARYWNRYGNCGVVVGATYPEELAQVRKIVGDMPILIPGIGAQGAEVQATVTAGKNSRGSGMIINASRSIIFASKGEDFAETARKATENLREEITKYIS